jgi:CRP-like cAMP-binding protein
MSIGNIPTEDLSPWMLSWDLEGDVVKALQDYGEEMKISARETIFDEGDPAGAMYLILEGMVLVLRKDEQGNEQTLTIIVEGQSFGEVGLLVDQPRMGTIAAGIDTTVVKITPDALSKMETERPQTALAFYKNLARSFAQQWIEVAHPHAEEE